MLKYIIEPTMSELGYDVTRSDKIDEAGIVTNQIVDRLLNDDVVIADLTDHNPNVFYELAIRHAVRRPVVLITDHAWPPPFDLNQARVIEFDTYDVNCHDEVRRKITEQALDLGDNPDKVFSPVIQAVELKNITRGGTEIEKALLPLVVELRSMGSRISRLESSSLPVFRPGLTFTPTMAGVQVSTASPLNGDVTREQVEAFYKVTGMKRPTDPGAA